MRLMWFVPPPVVVMANATDLAAPSGVEGVRNQSSDEQFDALCHGTIDAVVTAMDNVMAWNRRPGPGDFRIVAQTERTTPLNLMARPDVQSVADLRGRVVLVDAPDNGFVIALRALLDDSGLESAGYSLLPVGGVKERLDALLQARGAATLLGPPFDSMASQAGQIRLACVQDHYPTMPGQGLVVRAPTIDRLRSELSAWLTSLEAASRRMGADEHLARDVLVKSGFPPAAVEAMVATRPLTLRPDREGVELLVAHRRRLGLPGGEDSYETLVDDSLHAQPSGATA